MGSDNYYDENAQEFFDSTVFLDMTEFYAPFLSLLPQRKCKLLDAGCGSARDAKYFRDQGHEVSAFDASPEMVSRASEYLGQKVELKTFQEIDEHSIYDGIWACASLLHVSKSEMPGVMERLREALKPRGVLYTSFKYGDEEVSRNGRIFNNYSESSVQTLMSEAAGFMIEKVWITSDIRPGRDDEKWVNVLAKKIDGDS